MFGNVQNYKLMHLFLRIISNVKEVEIAREIFGSSIVKLTLTAGIYLLIVYNGSVALPMKAVSFSYFEF